MERLYASSVAPRCSPLSRESTLMDANLNTLKTQVSLIKRNSSEKYPSLRTWMVKIVTILYPCVIARPDLITVQLYVERIHWNFQLLSLYRLSDSGKRSRPGRERGDVGRRGDGIWNKMLLHMTLKSYSTSYLSP